MKKDKKPNWSEDMNGEFTEKKMQTVTEIL
jgi:hypothetical protein